jgi:hypothetical protein
MNDIRKGERTVDYFRNLLNLGDFLTGFTILVSQSIIDTILIQQQVQDIDPSERRGEM